MGIIFDRPGAKKTTIELACTLVTWYSKLSQAANQVVQFRSKIQLDELLDELRIMLDVETR